VTGATTGFDLLEAARLRRAGWPKRAVEDWMKAGCAPAALRYHCVGVQGGVRTPDGRLGTLWQVFDERCLVALMAERKTTKDLNGREYKPLREYATGDVVPVGMQTESRKGA